MKRTIVIVLTIFLFVVTVQAQELATVAERSGYTETSNNADVLDFLRALAASSSKVKLTTIGTSAGGNQIPLMIVGDPAPATPAELINGNRIAVYIQANIHAGEVEGKEATMMLARDIVGSKYPGLLDNLVLLIVPNYNADGNDQIRPENRSHQGGPEKGVGERANGMNLDLNRDWMKLESPEARAVVGQVLNRWNPVLLVDCHTTNGSIHLETMTWSPQLHPSGDAQVMDYTIKKLLPAAAATLKEKFGYDSIPYGNFRDRSDPSQGWSTFGHEPRYTTNYMGLRNRLSVLLETYAYAEFKDRVMSTYGMLVGLLKQCASDAAGIRSLVAKADARAYARAQGGDAASDTLAVEVKLEAYDEPITVKSFEFEHFVDDNGRERLRPTETRKDYVLPYFAKFVPTRTVPLPAWYVLQPGDRDIAKKLEQHGITVERLQKEVAVRAKRFYVTEMNSAENIFQGHRFTAVKGEWREEEVTLPAGSIAVNTAQPLGMLAACLLEPESDDGLTTWNFFDRKLTRQWGRGFLPHPVLCIDDQMPLPTCLY